jgi:hypothetical protein
MQVETQFSNGVDVRMTPNVINQKMLETYLNQFELGFLAKSKEFTSIRGIDKLVSAAIFQRQCFMNCKSG